MNSQVDPETKKIILSAIENDLIIYPIVKRSFEEADKDKSGYVDRSELAACMVDISVKLGASKPDQKAIDTEFHKLDINRDGRIDFKEFQIFVKENLKKILDK